MTSHNSKQQLANSAYSKLLEAITANEGSPTGLASLTVLGATGDWMSKLNHEELLFLMGQIHAQLENNVR